MSTLTNSVSPRPTGVRYGLIASVILIAIGLIFYVGGFIDYTKQGSAMQWVNSLLTYAIMIGAAVMGMKKHREDLGGFMTFGQGFMVGLWEFLVMALVTAVWSFLFFSFIAPDIIDMIMEGTREQMIARGTPDDQIDQAMKFTEMMMNPPVFAGIAAVSTFFTGLIFSLIVAAVMQRKPPVDVAV
ncbi:MAG: DUF4199 domain-containing protein [Saprospiraceae bacterium]|nr:DUF4199 domain-containing protein [Saprospiraceae bacterium]